MNQYRKIFAISLLSIAALTGCKKFVDVNNNPNSNTSTRADFTMSGALGTTYRNQVGTNLMIVPGTWTGIYAHSNSFTGGGNEKTYEYTTSDFNAFSPLFDNLEDYKNVIDNADKDGYGFWKDPANVMQCYVWQQLVDLYGDVPYEQALQGVANIQPAYKNQQAIYEDLVVRLDSAMDRMTRTTWPTSTEFTQQDIMFALNKTRWIQFANTLKLRILMRQSFMPGRAAYIQAKLATRVANGFMTQNATVQPGYQNITGRLNPFYINFGYDENNTQQQNYQYRKMNAVIINFLKGVGPGSPGVADTFRLQSLAYPIGQSFNTPATANTSITGSPTATVASYTGIPLGANSGFTNTNASPIGPFQIQAPDSKRPGLLMLFSESLFLQAEYVERYGGTLSGQTAAQLFNAGIISHFRTVGERVPGVITNPGTTANTVTDGFANRYIARGGTNVSYPGVLNTDLQAILVQKWVSLTHVNGLEQWSEYRKASGSATPGVPASVKTTAATANPEPVRYLYPQGEYDNNANNVPQGISRFTSKIFWDVN